MAFHRFPVRRSCCSPFPDKNALQHHLASGGATVLTEEEEDGVTVRAEKVSFQRGGNQISEWMLRFRFYRSNAGNGTKPATIDVRRCDWTRAAFI